MLYYRIDENGNIIDKATFSYAEDCLETDRNIVRDFNGRLIFEEETQTEEYLFAKQSFEANQDNEKQIAELTKKLQDTDYITNKLAEAVSKYIATGDNADVLKLREKYAKELIDRESWRKEINSLEKN